MTAKDTRKKSKNQINSADFEAFIDLVFGELDADEHIPYWGTRGSSPGYPRSGPDFLKLAQHAAHPLGCYFGCSTMKLDAEGRLYNRQSQFAGLYVVVLDDIGTGPGSKISPEKIPHALLAKATYCIESSPGNFQWGYVLEDPIRDLALAKALQAAVVHASGADAGGCMPNKLVRLPFGFNLKDVYAYEKGDPFPVKLMASTQEFSWVEPADLLAAADADVTWEQLKEGTAAPTRRSGTTHYRPREVYQTNLDGIVDPIVEWLAREKLIVNETGEWVNIECPWALGHSEGTNLAGYSPLGVGSRPMTRGFHCFHEHCQTHGTRDFLAWVTETGGPKAAQSAAIEKHVARYALNMMDNTVVDMTSPTLEHYKHQGFKNQLAGDVWLPDGFDDKGNPKFRPVSEYSLWAKDPDRMRLAGGHHIVGGPRVLTSSHGGYPHLNMWGLPGWGDGAFDEARAAPFVQFVRYLIPDEADATWFLDHLAAKAQNPHYRGPGIIMSTPTEGTGRGTLETILRRLWGASNVVNTTLSELVTGASSSDNNSWITADWVVIPEAKETDMTAKKEYTAYESLKRFIETGPSRIPIKEKWAITQEVSCYGSVIVCSQHADVLPLDAGSTRFKRIANVIEKWTDAQFTELYAWIESGFEKDVWRWLRARDISHVELFARQKEITILEEARIALSARRSVDAAIALSLAFAEEYTCGAVFVGEFVGILEHLEGPLDLSRITNWQRPVRRNLQNKTREVLNPTGGRWQPMISGSRVKLRATGYAAGVHLLAVAADNSTSLETAAIANVMDIKFEDMRRDFNEFCRRVLADVD